MQWDACFLFLLLHTITIRILPHTCSGFLCSSAYSGCPFVHVLLLPSVALQIQSLAITASYEVATSSQSLTAIKRYDFDESSHVPLMGHEKDKKTIHRRLPDEFL